MDFKQLIHSLSKINRELKEQSISAVNTSLTLRNWFFGFYIFEFEQHGKDRAEYGKALLATISEKMKEFRIPNCDERELRRYRQFYLAYPGIAKPVISDAQNWGLLPREFTENHIEMMSIQIRGSSTPELENDMEIMSMQIRGTATPEFKIPDSHYITLFKRISYTHFAELLRVEDPFFTVPAESPYSGTRRGSGNGS